MGFDDVARRRKDFSYKVLTAGNLFVYASVDFCFVDDKKRNGGKYAETDDKYEKHQSEFWFSFFGVHEKSIKSYGH